MKSKGPKQQLKYANNFHIIEANDQHEKQDGFLLYYGFRHHPMCYGELIPKKLAYRNLNLEILIIGVTWFP